MSADSKNTQKKTIHPVNGNVLCVVLEHDGRRPGSLIQLPDNAKGRPDRARVLAVSRGDVTVRGALVEPPVRVGQVVMFDPYRIARVYDAQGMGEAAGTPVAKAGDTFLIHQSNIHAVVE